MIMTDFILFGAFPYVAFITAVVMGVYRYFYDRFSYSSLSSQFLENRQLFWGSIPWHYGIVIILLTHLFAILFPIVWASLVGDLVRLYVVEVTGLVLGFLSIVGLVLLIVRRIVRPRLLVITSVMDWVLLAALLFQVITGVYIALIYRWGSVWYLQTAVPWLWSLIKLNPQVDYIMPLPLIVKLHMFNAFVIIALFPFTRLVHIFTIPIAYLWRPYQVAIWNRKH